MNKFSLAIPLALTILLSACGAPSDKGTAGSAGAAPRGGAVAAQAENQITVAGEEAPGPSSEDKSAGGETPSSAEKGSGPTKHSHRIQLTAINFLRGGFGVCDVKNQIYELNLDDERREFKICRNSSVEISMMSHGGKVFFKAVDLASQETLAASDSKSAISLVLGSRGMHRAQFENPYGFSYIMAEDVSGIEPELLERWNGQSSRVATLKGKILNAIRQGETVAPGLEASLAEEEMILRKIAEEIHATVKI